MEKIIVAGIGPGNIELITPLALKKIIEADIVIGGRRNIESLVSCIENKEIKYIGTDMNEIISYIRENRRKKITVAVTGDSLFYSMTSVILNHFNEDEVEIINGISSLHYLFGKVKMTYEEAYLGSVHGRDSDIMAKINSYKAVGLLTDTKNTPQKIAEHLDESFEYEIFVGENLSYDTEIISKYSRQQLVEEKKKFEINAVLIRKV